MKRKTRRQIGKVLGYLSAVVTVSVLLYALFALFFSTAEEKRLQQENVLYARYYAGLRDKERLVGDVVKGLELKDNALYLRIFGTEAPSVDAVTAADVISVSDSLSESFYLSYSASKGESLMRMAGAVEENFREICRMMLARRDSIPPLSMPLREVSPAQTGASLGMKHNALYDVDRRHEGLDLVAPQGTPVLAAADGTVRSVIRGGRSLGSVVEIDHRNGYVTRYALLGEVSVGSGQRVRLGQKVGTVGIFSSTFAPHLHYEVLRDGTVADPVHFLFASLDPESYAQMLYMAVSTRQSLD